MFLTWLAMIFNLRHGGIPDESAMALPNGVPANHSQPSFGLQSTSNTLMQAYHIENIERFDQIVELQRTFDEIKRFNSGIDEIGSCSWVILSLFFIVTVQQSDIPRYQLFKLKEIFTLL